MIVKNIIDEDFTNYKECAMFIGCPKCSFKCEIECGMKGMCQNTELVKSPDIDIDDITLINRYLNNPLSRAIVFGGLEPFDTWNELYHFIIKLRRVTDDTIIVYTGYYVDEIVAKINMLKSFSNIIIKFGRFIPNSSKRFDEVLGIELASNNQYAARIS